MTRSSFENDIFPCNVRRVSVRLGSFLTRPFHTVALSFAPTKDLAGEPIRTGRLTILQGSPPRACEPETRRSDAPRRASTGTTTARVEPNARRRDGDPASEGTNPPFGERKTPSKTIPAR